jgi:hypothetical protein
LWPVSSWLPGVGVGLRWALRWGAVHTGLPVLLVAAVGLVVSLRLVRRWAGFAVEIALAASVLAAATRFGWIRW